MYGRDTLIALEEESARVAADALGVPFNELIEILTQDALRGLDGLLAHLATIGEPAAGEAARLRAWRDRLRKSPMSFFAYRHEEAELDMLRAARRLREWLSRCEGAMLLVRSDLLRECTRGRRGSMDTLAACVTSRLDEIELFSPLTNGFNAAMEAVGDHRLLVIRSGIHDLLFSVVQLVVQYGIEVEGEEVDQRYMARHLRSYPAEFKEALESARLAVDIARGVRHSAPLAGRKLSLLEMHLVNRLLTGALSFVFFHEFGHVIVDRMAEPAHHELACDEFAARLVISSGDPAHVCGMYIAIELLEITGFMDGTAGRTATYPPIANRAKHLQLLIEELGAELDSAFDALLDITTRLKEEEVFRMDTSAILRQHLSTTLERLPELPLSLGDRAQLGGAVAEAAISLPKVEEDAIVSLQYDGRQRFRVIRFDMTAALTAAAGVVGGIAGSTNPWVIGAAVVACLASLKSMARSLGPVEGAILFALYLHHPSTIERQALDQEVQKLLPRGGPTPADIASALQSLISLGCIRASDSGYRLSEYVLVRMPWPPSLKSA